MPWDVQLSSRDKRPLSVDSCALSCLREEVRGSRGSGVLLALSVPWNPPNTTHHGRRLQVCASLHLPSFLLLLAQPCLPSHGTQR